MIPTRTLLLCLGLSASALAQGRFAIPVDALNARDEVFRQERIAITGDLGFAPLPPVTSSSPLNSIMFADRLPHGASGSYQSAAAEGEGPDMIDGVIPAGPSGTGTAFPEIFKYQVPTNYDEFSPPVPLVVGYHGFGGSADSVALFSTLEEECEARGWIYMAPTGLDDQLFGSPISQQNTEAAIQFMVDSFEVDPDRIYMVGFSMGGGVVANFASRRRDPDGLMIAAVGMVSGSFDWTLSYNVGTAPIKTWLENQYNFGGSPSAQAFRYHQASTIYFDELSYPPSTLLPITDSSMANNLADIPVYMTYDTGDTLTYIPPTNEALDSYLTGFGGSVTKTVVSGTVDPATQLPAPHSWVVLDEVDLLDWFAPKTAVRTPEDFEALQDLGGPASWVSTTQHRTGNFTAFDASADVPSTSVSVLSVENADDVVLDVGEVALGNSFPLRVDVSSADVDGFRLELTGFDVTPSYLTQAVGGALVTLVDSDPNSNSLFVDVPGNTSLSVDVRHETDWTTKFTTSPNPVPIGTSTTITVDAPSAATLAFMIVATSEQLYTVKGSKLTASLAPPSFLVSLPLNGSGDISFPVTIDNDPLLQGLRFPIQIATLNALFTMESVSNLWGFKIE